MDSRTGYRYYRSDQVRTVTTIALLRGLDVPLPVVREVLTAPDEKTVTAVLAARRGRVAAEVARREQVLRSLDALPPAYAAVLEHVRERGHQARGPVTETCLTDPGTVTPDDLVTRVSLALEP